jgi:hypothetical protein
MKESIRMTLKAINEMLFLVLAGVFKERRFCSGSGILNTVENQLEKVSCVKRKQRPPDSIGARELNSAIQPEAAQVIRFKEHHIVNKGLLTYSSLLHGKPHRPDLCPKQIVLYSIEILVWSSQTIGQQVGLH